MSKLVTIALASYMLLSVVVGQVPSRSEAFLASLDPLTLRDFTQGRKCDACRIEILSREEGRIYFQYRNMKPTGASGLVGNFYIEESSLQIFFDQDPPKVLPGRRIEVQRQRFRKIIPASPSPKKLKTTPQ